LASIYILKVVNALASIHGMVAEGVLAEEWEWTRS
jgi:hypothetical protein